MSKDGHGNKVHRYPPEHIDTRKISADSVTYGRDISGGRDFVWGAYDNGVLVAVAATAPEARRKYREKMNAHRYTTDDLQRRPG